MPKFSISNFHIGVRARGVAAGQILPAFGGGVHPCHSVAVKLNYSTCKRDVSRAVGIPSSGDSGQSGHQGTESPLHEIWWGFRPVGIPSSGDSV